MQHFGFRSLFARLFVSVFFALIVFAIAMLTLSQLVHQNSHTISSRSIAQQLALQIDPFLNDVNTYHAEGKLLQTRFSLAVVKKTFDIFDENLNAKIGLYDKDNHLILQTNNSDLPSTLPPDEGWSFNIFGPPAGFRPHVVVDTASGYQLWYESRTPPNRPYWSRWVNLFTGTILLLTIMSVVLWLLARSWTDRIDQMAQKIQLMGDGDFSVRVDEQGNDEIAALAYGFNQSAEKIQQLINANSLLLAHASHEFRTPITRMRLQTEMLSMLADRLDGADKDAFVKRTTAINKDLTGLNDLIESILLVSRLDAGHALENMQMLDFYELISEECQHFEQATLFGESVQIEGQPKLLVHLIRNLLNNALIHGIPPMTVYVYGCQTSDETKQIPDRLIAPQDSTDGGDSDTNSEKDNDKDDKQSIFFRPLLKPTKPATAPTKFAVLAVLDEGSGIPVDKREDIFSPFVRLKQEKKGSGLGLSLVAQIIEMHNGKIITDTWQGKTRFLAVLPVKQKRKVDEKKDTQ